MTISPNLRRHTAELNESLLDVSRKLGHRQAVIIINQHSQPKGLCTDGDIRRALLNGATMHEPIHKWMNTKPILGQIGRKNHNQKQLARAAAAMHPLPAMLPIIDAQGKLCAINTTTPQTQPDNHYDVLIMAGGFGTRLGKLTETTPKPLVKIDGKPMLEHILGKVKAELQPQKIRVSVHYLFERIEAFLAQHPANNEVELIIEDKPLGSAGALGHLNDQEHTQIVINSDVLTRVDLRRMLEFHQSDHHVATIAAARFSYQLPFGAIELNDKGNFNAIAEKPIHHWLVAAGVYILNPTVLRLIEPKTTLSMPELLKNVAQIGFPVAVFPIHEYWRDIGRPADLIAAQNEFSNAEPD